MNVYPERGTAVRVTAVPGSYSAWSGDFVTDPPTAVIFRTYPVCICVKLAVTLLLESMVIVAGFMLPDNAPDHPVNWYPVLAVAVSVTTWPASYSERLGDFATCPLTAVTFKVYVGGCIPPTVNVPEFNLVIGISLALPSDIVIELVPSEAVLNTLKCIFASSPPS